MEKIAKKMQTSAQISRRFCVWRFCAAVCFAESGSYTAAPEYMCEQTKCLLEQIRADEIWKNTENRGKN